MKNLIIAILVLYIFFGNGITVVAKKAWLLVDTFVDTGEVFSKADTIKKDLGDLKSLAKEIYEDGLVEEKARQEAHKKEKENGKTSDSGN